MAKDQRDAFFCRKDHRADPRSSTHVKQMKGRNSNLLCRFKYTGVKRDFVPFPSSHFVVPPVGNVTEWNGVLATFFPLLRHPVFIILSLRGDSGERDRPSSLSSSGSRPLFFARDFGAQKSGPRGKRHKSGSHILANHVMCPSGEREKGIPYFMTQ